MSETIIDSTSIAASGTESGTCAIEATSDTAVIAITGFDSNSTDLDVAVTSVKPVSDDTFRPLDGNPSVTGIDATGSGAVATLSGLDGLRELTVTVTNNAGSATTVTVVEDTAV